ncbi:Pannexin-2 [Camelus dromedarius]|uniref:Pannexin-2 n=1 Tax=Camelus dromedarius TaxID=9838 RepID=A0A5N4DGY1_CAMDR|nr:Pannexin-2 [Camelus dromedarius]
MKLLEQSADMATALLAGEKLRELILPGAQDDKAGALAALLLQLKLELPSTRASPSAQCSSPSCWSPWSSPRTSQLITACTGREGSQSEISHVSLAETVKESHLELEEEPIYCYTPHNFTRDQALYARGYCWTELRDALPGVDASLWPSLFEHKLLPYSLLAFAAIMYVPALGWEFLASTRLTSELNFLLQEIDNCYHRAAEGRAPKIEKQIQSKGPGITERERREIIENAEKEKSPEQNLFEKYLERRGRSNFLAKLYLARHLLILLLSVAPISYLCTYYATQKQNEFTCALGAAPGGGGPAVRVSCKLPSVQLQRIVAGVDIVLLCSMNLIILVNLIHLFIFRKSNFIFDKLHKVGIKTRRQWRRSQFCDINILAMFCNENRDHIKSLNRLDFITNESDLMYDNVVRQLLAALAQSNHDATPTVRDAGVQTVDPSANPAEPDGAAEPPVVKRPRKKMKWIPSSNPLPQPFKEPLAIMRVENSKAEKPKPVRRKTATDTLIAPLLDAGARAAHHYKGGGGDAGSAPDKKHARHFSLDVHPYVLGTKKAKPEAVPAALPASRSQDGGFLSQAEECALGLTAAPTAAPATAPLSPASLSKADPLAILSRNATHPLLHISTLYEAREEEDGAPRAPPDVGGLITIPPPQQILIATFDEPRTVVSTVEF